MLFSIRFSADAWVSDEPSIEINMQKIYETVGDFATIMACILIQGLINGKSDSPKPPRHEGLAS